MVLFNPENFIFNKKNKEISFNYFVCYNQKKVKPRINILKLESYMLGESFTSAQFYIDIEGHPESPSVRLALEELGFFSKEVRILGVYKGDVNRKTG